MVAGTEMDYAMASGVGAAQQATPPQNGMSTFAHKQQQQQQQMTQNDAGNNTSVAHLSSNGYYGFSWISESNKAQALDAQQDNNNNNNNNNNDAAAPDNNNFKCNEDFNASLTIYLPAELPAPPSRKRGATSASQAHVVGGMEQELRKRCRYDAKQRHDMHMLTGWNMFDYDDSIEMPETGEAQQYEMCDTDMDMAMAEVLSAANQTNAGFNMGTAVENDAEMQATMPTAGAPTLVPIQTAQAETPHAQQLFQQMHFPGHLHRANRDVNRCMLSHMI